MLYIELSFDEIYSPLEQELYVLEDNVYVPVDTDDVDENLVYYMAFDDEDEGVFEPYELVPHQLITNPKSLKLYVYDDEDDTYVLTEDEEVDQNTEYYRYASDTINYESVNDNLYFVVDLEYEEITNPSESGLYVYQDEMYVPTTDIEPVSEVMYYRFIDPDPVEEEEDDVEYDEESYILGPTPDVIAEPDDGLSTENEEYSIAVTTFVTNPSSMGLYEYVETNGAGSFTPTSDTEVDPYKIYYEHIIPTDYRPFDIPEGGTPIEFDVFEKNGDEYEVSMDETVVSGKTYYVYDPFYPDYEEFGEPGDVEFELEPDEAEPASVE